MRARTRPGTAIDANTVIQWNFSEATSPFANTGNGGALSLAKWSGAIESAPFNMFGKRWICTDQGFATADTSIGESSSFTVSSWVMFTSHNPAETTLFGKCYSAGKGWVGPYASAALHIVGATNRLYVIDALGSNEALDLNGQGMSAYLTSGRPHLLALTYDASALRVYVDGIQLYTRSSSPVNWGSHGCWMLGQNGSNGPQAHLFADYRVDNVARSQPYLLNRYNLERPLV